MATHTHSLKSFQLRNKTAGHLLLEFSNFGYMWTSVDTKKIVASHIIYSILEIEPFTELLTVPKWRKFVHPHDLNKLIQAEEYVLITGESTSVEYRLITNRGKTLYVNHHMQLSRSSNDIKVMSIVEDITEQKRGDVILDTMNEGFFELDDNFCFRRLNKHTEKFWSIHRDNILGKRITDVFPDSQETFFYKLIIEAKAKKTNLIDDVVSPVRNTWIRISVSPYNDGVIVVFYDIDVEKRAEEKIIGLNSSLWSINKELNSLNAELKNFATIAADNYGELLRHLYINMEIVVTSDAHNLSNSGRANLRRAQGAIQKVKLLTDDINRYLRLYDVDMQKQQIEPAIIIQEVLSKSEKKITEANALIELDKLPPLSADPFLFSTLMSNLLDNAIKFRKAAQPLIIKINSSQTDVKDLSLKTSNDNHYIVISVTDNGIGFNPGNSEKIFELFSKAHEKDRHKGSGIGLAICKKIMEMHGGFITAEGVENEGASFHCYFPAGGNSNSVHHIDTVETT